MDIFNFQFITANQSFILSDLNKISGFLPLLLFLFVIVAFLLNLLGIKLASFFNIVDNPTEAPNRKFQSRSIPLMGFFGSFLCVICFLIFINFAINTNYLNLKSFFEFGLYYDFNLSYIIFGTILIYFFGFLDDKFKLKPIFYFPLLVLGLFSIVFGGNLKIEAFSYPFNAFNLAGNPLSYLMAFIWLGVCMSSTKFLDGHDGLVSSVGLISFLTISQIAIIETVNQPLIYCISIVFAAACLGFLPFNLPNAKAYLGEGGSTIIGLWIGILSILSGAKVATIFSVLGWFIIDIIFVFAFRFWKGGIKNVLKADSNLHWHHRLKNLGLNKWQVLIISVIFISLTSQLGIYLQTYQKGILLILQIILVGISFIGVYRTK